MSYVKVRPLGIEQHHALWQGPNGYYLSDSAHPTGSAEGPALIDLSRQTAIGLRNCAVPVVRVRTGDRTSSVLVSHRAYRDILTVIALPSYVTEEATDLIQSVASAPGTVPR